MRLIDADDLMDEINWLIGQADRYNRDLYEDFAMRVKNARTIEAEPVRIGKWIDETFEPWGLVYHPYKCDQCGEHAESDSNYCPNCGADMRGKVVNDCHDLVKELVKEGEDDH